MMSAKKRNPRRMLMVTYGGMHVHMMAIFANFLKEHTDIHFVIIGLTTAKKILAEQYRLQSLGFGDFPELLPEHSLDYGKLLFQKLQSSGRENLISRNESEAYLGASFVELIHSLGSEEKAFDVYAKRGRACFLPVQTMSRIIDFYQPDYVLTTNSPRCEQAAQMVAQRKNIPTGMMVDLVGAYERYQLCASHIFVMNEIAQKNLIQKYHVNAKSIFITGNPYFDMFRFVVPHSEQKKLDMGFPQSKKVFLWADQLGSMDISKNQIVSRPDDDIVQTLEGLIHISRKHNLSLAYRPHPSQNANVLQKLIDQSGGVAKNVGAFPLLETLQAADYVGSFASSVLLHAKIMKKITLQLNITEGESFIPLANNRDAFEFESLDEMDVFFQQAINMPQPDAQATSFSAQEESASQKIYDIIESALSG